MTTELAVLGLAWGVAVGLGVRCLERPVGRCDTDPPLALRVTILRVFGRPLDDILQTNIQRSNPAH